jgi:SGNH domain (fused to AT3 domains)
MTVTLLAVIGVIASTVAMALLYGPDTVERAYMGTDARILEPLVGAFGAVVVASGGFRHWLERHGRAVLLAGTVGVIAGVVLIRPEDSFYYYGGSLLFSVATLMMVAPLWVDRGGVGSRSLSWKPVAWVGVVSYGIYLWHWPIILWLGVRQANGLRYVVLAVSAAALTVLIAALSFYLLELPIRRGHTSEAHALTRRFLQRPGVVLAAVPVVLLLVASVSVAATRVPPPAAGVPVVMLTGDSVPLHLEVAFEEASAAEGWRMVSAAQGGCPVSGETSTKMNGDIVHEAAACSDMTIPAQDELIHQVDPSVVVWWDRWSLSSFLTPAGERVRSGTREFWTLRSQILDATVRRLTADGAHVVFVATEPPGEGVLSLCGAERCLPDWNRFQIDHYRDITTPWNEILRQYAEEHPDLATFVSVTDAVCHDDAVPCDDTIEGEPARPDGTHYAGAGEQEVASLLADLVAPQMTQD